MLLGLVGKPSCGKSTFFKAATLSDILIASYPFATIDAKGVGRLMEISVQLGRETRPGMEIGICGEHGGEPKSIALCHNLGLNYVSCSPFRVPVARLAAAHAAMADDD